MSVAKVYCLLFFGRVSSGRELSFCLSLFSARSSSLEKGSRSLACNLRSRLRSGLRQTHQAMSRPKKLLSRPSVMTSSWFIDILSTFTPVYTPCEDSYVLYISDSYYSNYLVSRILKRYCSESSTSLAI